MPHEIETREGEPLQLRAALAPSTANDADRTIELTWSTGSEVRRYDWRTDREYLETLSMDPKHVRLQRLNDGGPVLNSHSSYSLSSVLGAVAPGTARADGTTGTARVRFSKRDDVAPIWQDVRDGIISSVSVGYRVHKWQVTAAQGDQIERRTAVDWEPYEISMVAIPADAGAKTRNLSVRNNVTEQNENPGAEPQQETRADGATLERQRAATIVELCDSHKVDAGKRSEWLRSSMSVRDVKLAILDDMEARSRETHVGPPITGGDGRREQNAVRDASDALIVRAGGRVEGDGYRNFADGSLHDIARRVLEMGGVRTSSLSKNELAKRAMATSDFANILYAAGERLVRTSYESVPLVHRDIFRKSTAKDFREMHRIVNAGAAILPEVPEGGVIQQHTAVSEISSYAIKQYGSIIAITRKLIIDDDFNLVADAASARGRAAAETERKLVWDFITSNAFAGPTSQDGTAVFTTGHANFPSASGTPISADMLTAARVSFGNRLGPDGFAMNAQLRHIVTSVVGEAAWDVLLNGMYVPTSTSGAVTERMRQVQLHVEPLISTTKKHWYGFTDHNQVSHFEYAYLAGNEGPRLEQRNAFNPEGIELKVCLDFGIGAIDYRGCYMQRET